MFKNVFLKKAVSFTVISAFALSSVPQKAEAMLVPISFSQMYYLAQNGEVEALRGSVRRGMNIDVMNQNGDTGLCIAARRGDSYTYNAFRAAGANPRHPCTQSIDGYEDFVNSSRTVSINSTPRAAFGMMGKEAYTVSPWVWWTLGGAAVIGGVAVAAGGGGGGGGGGSSAHAPENKVNSAGKYLAKKGKIITTAYKGEEKENTKDRSITASQTDEKKELIANMDFNKDVLNYGKELSVILRAVDGGYYANSEGTELKIKNGEVAMSAYKSSSHIKNEGHIVVGASNAAIGMLAGQDAKAINYATGADGIDLSFSGKNSTDTIIGMYADAGGEAANRGDIRGSTTLTSEESGTTSAKEGKIVGMEAMILNDNFNSSDVETRLRNTGKIDLVAGDGKTDSTEVIKVGLIGMGSYLDNKFLNENKDIAKRGEKVTLTNTGEIELSYYGLYESDALSKGTGGIVGMRADANAIAENSGNSANIHIIMSESDTDAGGEGDITDAVAAGMQSVHGGKLMNSGSVYIQSGASDSRTVYGMVAVKGSGSNTNLYHIKPELTNDGTIKMEVSGSYGMASYNGAGKLINDINGLIILGKNNAYSSNVGMYGFNEQETEIENKGEIKIYSTESVGIKNEYNGVTIKNDGTITIEKSAFDSHPFAGSYENIINSGTINYNTTWKEPVTEEPADDDDDDIYNVVSVIIKDAVINTDGNNEMDGEDSLTEIYLTNDGNINLNGSSYVAAIAGTNNLPKIYNSNKITINDRDNESSVHNAGIYITDSVANGSYVENSGEITVNTAYSHGIISEAKTAKASIVNTETGVITITKEYSEAMVGSDTSSVYNRGIINVNGNYSQGITVKGTKSDEYQQKIYNNIINLNGDNSIAVVIFKGSKAKIEKGGSGNINVAGNYDVGYHIGGETTLSEIFTVSFVNGDESAREENRKTFRYYTVDGKLEINVDGTVPDITGGTFVYMYDGAEVENNTDLKTGGTNVTFFKGKSSSSLNNASLTLQHENSFGMVAEAAHEATNKGTIELKSSATQSAAMVANGSGSSIINDGKISVYAENSKGMDVTEGGKAENNFDKRIEIYADNSIGVDVNGSGSTFTNNGEIWLGATDEENPDISYGVKATSSGVVTNGENGIIYVNRGKSQGIYISGVTTGATNNGNIYVNGKKSTGIVGNGGTIANSGNGRIVVSGENTCGIYSINGKDVSNSAIINVLGNDSFGMYNDGGESFSNKKIINVSGAGSYGMYSTGGTINNDKNGVISVSFSGTDSSKKTVGMHGEDGTTVNNSGTIYVMDSNAIGISVTGGNAIANNTGDLTVYGGYGMYATNGATINHNSGTITVNGGNGMYASGEESKAFNNSTINVSSDYGMHATNGGKVYNQTNGKIVLTGGIGMYGDGAGSVAYNYGVIDISAGGSAFAGNYENYGEVKEPKETGDETGGEEQSAPALAPMALSATNFGKIVNNGIIKTSSSLDFDNYTDDTGTISVGNGGSYEASSFSGDVVADSNITYSGFEDEYINKNSFVGEDNGLNIVSGSYLFEAQKTLNDEGNTDVVMNMKNFTDVVKNSSLADFLADNYNDKNNENLFIALKSAGDSVSFNNKVDELFGKNMLSNLTFEDLNMLRELNFDMNNNIFSRKKGTFALSDGVETVKNEKFGSVSRYALSGYNDGKNSVAVGLAVSDVRTTKNNGGQKSKLDKNIMMSVPVARKVKGFEFVASPKLGYAQGTYEREGLNGKTYEGTIEKKMFALMNEARYPLEMRGVKVIPSAEFNMVGYNIKGREKQKQFSLNIDSQNHYSVESGLGFSLEKEFSPSKDSKLKLNGGVAVYKEFADPYELKVGMNDMKGTYKINDESRGDKRTVLRFGIGYNLRENMDISATMRTNIDREYRTDTGVNLNYRF